MIKKVLKYLFLPFKKVFKWISRLLSDSQEASVRRILALLSFALLYDIFKTVRDVTVTGIAIPAENARIIIHFADIFSWICLGGMGLVTVSHLTQIVVSRYKSLAKAQSEYWQSMNDGAEDIKNQDPWKISKDDEEENKTNNNT